MVEGGEKLKNTKWFGINQGDDSPDEEPEEKQNRPAQARSDQPDLITPAWTTKEIKQNLQGIVPLVHTASRYGNPRGSVCNSPMT